MPDHAGADIVLVNPRFEASYWGLEGALPLLGKRAAMPVASLPLLAALTPPPHRVRIVDENVTPTDFDDKKARSCAAVGRGHGFVLARPCPL